MEEVGLSVEPNDGGLSDREIDCLDLFFFLLLSLGKKEGRRFDISFIVQRQRVRAIGINY